MTTPEANKNSENQPKNLAPLNPWQTALQQVFASPAEAELEATVSANEPQNKDETGSEKEANIDDEISLADLNKLCKQDIDRIYGAKERAKNIRPQMVKLKVRKQEIEAEKKELTDEEARKTKKLNATSQAVTNIVNRFNPLKESDQGVSDEKIESLNKEIFAHEYKMLNNIGFLGDDVDIEEVLEAKETLLVLKLLSADRKSSSPANKLEQMIAAIDQKVASGLDAKHTQYVEQEDQAIAGISETILYLTNEDKEIDCRIDELLADEDVRVEYERLSKELGSELDEIEKIAAKISQLSQVESVVEAQHAKFSQKVAEIIGKSHQVKDDPTASIESDDILEELVENPNSTQDGRRLRQSISSKLTHVVKNDLSESVVPSEIVNKLIDLTPWIGSDEESTKYFIAYKNVLSGATYQDTLQRGIELGLIDSETAQALQYRIMRLKEENKAINEVLRFKSKIEVPNSGNNTLAECSSVYDFLSSYSVRKGKKSAIKSKA